MRKFVRKVVIDAPNLNEGLRIEPIWFDESGQQHGGHVIYPPSPVDLRISEVQLWARRAGKRTALDAKRRKRGVNDVD